jgi:predicted secreted protein
MNRQVFDIGDKPTVTVTFTNEAGTPTNPTTVVGLLRLPSGTESTLAAPTNPSAGVYAWALPELSQQGEHVVRAKATSGLVAAVEISFTVRATAFANP